jgi:7-cyano-7-deazaguanine synthase
MKKTCFIFYYNSILLVEKKIVCIFVSEGIFFRVLAIPRKKQGTTYIIFLTEFQSIYRTLPSYLLTVKETSMKKEAAMVCFSGGQDSTTCLFWAKKHFKHVESVCFTYGQKHSAETMVAHSIADNAGIPFQLLDVSLLGQLSCNSLTNSSIEMDTEKPSDSYPNTFVPGRNMVFLTLAAILARSKGIFNLVTGVSEADFSGYPDCRDTFIRSLNVTLNLAMDEQFIIHTPLMDKNKSEVWEMADKLEVFDLIRNQTLTCYNGILADGCGHCPACKLRKEGLENYLKRKNN